MIFKLLEDIVWILWFEVHLEIKKISFKKWNSIPDPSGSKITDWNNYIPNLFYRLNKITDKKNSNNNSLLVLYNWHDRSKHLKPRLVHFLSVDFNLIKGAFKIQLLPSQRNACRQRWMEKEKEEGRKKSGVSSLLCSFRCGVVSIHPAKKTWVYLRIHYV